MADKFSYNVFGTDDLAEVPRAHDIQDGFLDARHMSKSALRAFDLLEFFASRKRPARATEIANALRLSPSSADQLLKSLASRAYLIFDSQYKLYRPSPRLLGFCAFLSQSYFGENRLHELMRHLVGKTDCSISICTPFGRLMQLVDFLPGPNEGTLRQPGELFQMFNSAAGAAMLATWPVVTVRKMIDESADQLGDAGSDPQAILAYLDEVRVNGHAFGGVTIAIDRCSIAIALPRSALDVELTLTLRGAIDHVKANRWRFAALAQESAAAHLTG